VAGCAITEASAGIGAPAVAIRPVPVSDEAGGSVVL